MLIAYFNVMFVLFASLRFGCFALVWLWSGLARGWACLVYVVVWVCLLLLLMGVVLLVSGVVIFASAGVVVIDCGYGMVICGVVWW